MKLEGITVLSLFNGMSCGYMALDKLGVKVKKYYSSEIDKHAIKASKLCFPDIIELGDVTKWESWNIDLSEIDIVIAGSPCQGFSFAGKQLAFDDPRSKLFFEFLKIWHKVKQHNPNAEFLLENVKMKREHELVISRYMGVAPIEINSSLLSAQNRQRLYWTSIANKPFGLFDDMECTIPQPKDKGILLKDVLESDVPEKYYLSEKALSYIERGIEKGRDRIDFNDGSKKTSCLTVNYHKGIHNQGETMVCVAQRGRNPENPKSRIAGLPTEQQLEPRFDGKTNCLTSVQKDNLVLVGGIKNGIFQEGITSDFSQGARVYSTDGKSTCLSSECGGMGAKTGLYQTDYRIRRLTPRECGRLQTIPEDILEKMLNSGISDTQLYRMFGNGWTVDVIAYIFSFANFNKI